MMYAIAIAVAFIHPGLSFAIDGAIVVYFLVSRSDVPGLIHRAARGRRVIGGGGV
jgi:hypothetical protein